MKLKLNVLKGFTLNAQDGEIGKIKDVLFDDHQWGGRWVVADTGSWLPGRKVLLSPISFEEPDLEKKRIPVSMTKEDIQNSPALAEDAPVSLQYEKTFYDQFYWPYYWIGGGLWGNQTSPMYLNPNRNQEESLDPETRPDPEHQDHVLRSAVELQKYQLISSTSPARSAVGMASDLIIDTQTWSVPYLIAQNRILFPTRKILLPRELVSSTNWAEHSIFLRLDELSFEDAPSLEEDIVTPEMEERAKAFFDSVQ